MSTTQTPPTKAELIEIRDSLDQIAARMRRSACALELLGHRAGDLLDLSPNQSDALNGLVCSIGGALQNDSGTLDLISRERLAQA
jgi:hypothetical protein